MGRPKGSKNKPKVAASDDILSGDVVPQVVEALSAPDSPEASPVARLPGGPRRVGRPRKDRQALVKAAAEAVGLTIKEPEPKLNEKERPVPSQDEAGSGESHRYWHLLRAR